MEIQFVQHLPAQCCVTKSWSNVWSAEVLHAAAPACKIKKKQSIASSHYHPTITKTATNLYQFYHHMHKIWVKTYFCRAIWTVGSAFVLIPVSVTSSIILPLFVQSELRSQSRWQHGMDVPVALPNSLLVPRWKFGLVLGQSQSQSQGSCFRSLCEAAASPYRHERYNLLIQLTVEKRANKRKATFQKKKKKCTCPSDGEGFSLPNPWKLSATAETEDVFKKKVGSGFLGQLLSCNKSKPLWSWYATTGSLPRL